MSGSRVLMADIIVTEVVNRESSVYNLNLFQREVAEFAAKNFPGGESWHPLLGITEEVGELNHAYLKREQGIRGTPEKHAADIKDAVGDIVVYLADFCSRNGLNLQDCIEDVWTQVQNRDWRKNPLNGMPPGHDKSLDLKSAPISLENKIYRLTHGGPGAEDPVL